MKTRDRRKLLNAILVSLILTVLVVVGVVYAATVNIDTLNAGEQQLTVNTVTTSASDSADGGGDVLGRYRDAQLFWVAGDPNKDVNLKIDAGGTTDELSFAAEPDAQGRTTITWDGDTDPDTLDPVGLGDADLESSSPANDGILVAIEYADRTATLKFTGYDDASNYEDLSYTVNHGDLEIQRMDLFFPFGNFTIQAGTGADWSSLGALELDISGDTALDLTVDYLETTTGFREYGDLPSSSPDYTNVLDAYHVPEGLTLGANLDTETAANASSDAEGDDGSEFDDEDGATPVIFSFLGTDYWGAQVTVNGCAGTCYLNGWIDWNNDGDFGDAGEHPISQGVSNGMANYPLDEASQVATGSYYLRFRVCDNAVDCDDPGVDQDEAVKNGEVEDYRWSFGTTAVVLSSLGTAGQGAVAWWPAAAAVVLGTGAVGLAWRRRRS
jgi:hypothetical protein